MTADVYAPVNRTWPAELPAITREEAQRAATKLRRHFYPREGGSAAMANRAWVRRSWISTRPRANGVPMGWWRLVHDVSHRVFIVTHPKTRPHGDNHARLEADMVAYVLAQGWLDGRLKTKPPVKRSRAERRAKDLADARAKVAAWTRKQTLAKTKVRAWTRKVRVIERRLAS